MAGKRFSQQRELIYQFVASGNTHPTADTVFRALKKDIPSLSLGTVYRNLNLLSDEGLLLRLPYDTDRYDATVTPHAHLECTCCGGVFDLQGDTSPIQADFARLNPGIKLDLTTLMFRGLCTACKSSSEAVKNS